jgi:hypothetical protein
LFSQENHYLYIVINPLISNRLRKSNLRKVKTDAADAYLPAYKGVFGASAIISVADCVGEILSVTLAAPLSLSQPDNKPTNNVPAKIPEITLALFTRLSPLPFGFQSIHFVKKHLHIL